jgi:hypothetical protein
MKNQKKNEIAVFVAGDKKIFFPAIVLFESLKEKNSSGFDLFLCFDQDDLTSQMSEALEKRGINFIDAKSVEGYDASLRAGQCLGGRFPPEVCLSWCLPQHLLKSGYRLSMKLDYDLLCTGPLDGLLEDVSEEFFLSFSITQFGSTIPDDALEQIKAEMGLKEPQKFLINPGVALLDNQKCEDESFYEKIFKIIEILSGKGLKLRALEVAALALFVANHESGFVAMPERYNHRATAGTADCEFEPIVSFVHYLTRHKPWLPFSMADLKEISKMGATRIPFYRNLWINFASKIDGFSEYCSEKPYNDLELIGIAGAVLQVDRDAIETKNASSSTARDIIVRKRINISDKIAEKLNWTVAYGPFKGLKMSEKTWWSRPSRAAMFLGIYEQEVLQSLMDTPDDCDTFIDIGAADGYYAVGSLVCGKFSSVYCFEMSDRGRQAILNNAAMNGKQNHIKIFGKADSNIDQYLPEGKLEKSVILVDIEGAEFDLLTPVLFEKMKDSIIIVEIHEWRVPDGKARLDELKKASLKTHQMSELTTTSRDLSGFPELEMMSDTDRWLICSEGRGRLMKWFRFDPIGNEVMARAFSPHSGSRGIPADSIS